MLEFRAPFMLVEESQVVGFWFAIYRNDSYVKKVGHFIQKQSYLGECETCYSNSKTVVISSQDSQWIILFKYDGGVLSYMFFYNLVIT